MKWLSESFCLLDLLNGLSLRSLTSDNLIYFTTARMNATWAQRSNSLRRAEEACWKHFASWDQVAFKLSRARMAASILRILNVSLYLEFHFDTVSERLALLKDRTSNWNKHYTLV